MATKRKLRLSSEDHAIALDAWRKISQRSGFDDIPLSKVEYEMRSLIGKARAGYYLIGDPFVVAQVGRAAPCTLIRVEAAERIGLPHGFNEEILALGKEYGVGQGRFYVWNGFARAKLVFRFCGVLRAAFLIGCSLSSLFNSFKIPPPY